MMDPSTNVSRAVSADRGVWWALEATAPNCGPLEAFVRCDEAVAAALETSDLMGAAEVLVSTGVGDDDIAYRSSVAGCSWKHPRPGDAIDGLELAR